MFKTFITYRILYLNRLTVRVNVFHLGLQKRLKILTFYEKVHKFFGHPVHYKHYEMKKKHYRQN